MTVSRSTVDIPAPVDQKGHVRCFWAVDPMSNTHDCLFRNFFTKISLAYEHTASVDIKRKQTKSQTMQR